MIRRYGIGLRLCSLVVILSACSAIAAQAEPLPLKRAVELALSHATATGISTADTEHALAAYRESHNNYIPQFIFGAGLGKSWGYPLTLEGSAPSIFNINTQSALFNPALSKFISAARTEWKASTLQNQDQRNQVIQDTVVSYVELNKWEQRITRLHEDEAAANKLEQALAERVKEGVDSPVEQTKARLAAARVRLRVAEAEGSADVLRQHLGKLTALPAASIETVPDALPAFAPVSQEDDLVSKAETNSPVVLAAEQHARAQYLRADAEHKAKLPSVDFAAQYARLSTYNNYDQFFQPHSFRPNNATIGVAIRFPLINYSQRARAEAADADAVKAHRQAESAKNKVSEETLRLQRTVRQLQAAQEVAELELQLAQSNVDSTQTRLDAGTATIKDLGEMRAQLSERYITLQDTNFELQRAHIGLLRSTGELEKWINGGLASTQP